MNLLIYAKTNRSVLTHRLINCSNFSSFYSVIISEEGKVIYDKIGISISSLVKHLVTTLHSFTSISWVLGGSFMVINEFYKYKIYKQALLNILRPG